MLKIHEYPIREEWDGLMQRAFADNSALRNSVAEILNAVKNNGDVAIYEFARKFDGATITDLLVSAEEIEKAQPLVSDELKDAISVAAHNIAQFHEAQRMIPVDISPLPGVRCQQMAVPISKVGLYIPGGNSPLFSTVLMLAIPAKIAGCKEIILCTPPDRNGSIHPAIIYAAIVAGVNRIYKVGGAQAIGAMAYGTKSIPKVSKIFGPGNKYVMEAKMQVSMQDVAIDMPAGPSEVMVIADGAANPEFVASDFLSQSEHGPDSQSILLTTSRDLAIKMPESIEKLLVELPRKDMIAKSLSHSRIILFENDDDMWDFANRYAPEHLILNCENARDMIGRVENAGSVFIGAYSPESVGDYASGTNHTLPTSGYAKAYSGVNLDSFSKKITFQEITPQGLIALGKSVEIMAENEDLIAHKMAVTIRLKDINQNTTR